VLVAGAGFEPATFRLWAWRMYLAAHKTNATPQNKLDKFLGFKIHFGTVSS